MPAQSCCITPLPARSSADIQRLCWRAESNRPSGFCRAKKEVASHGLRQEEADEETMNYTAQYLRESIQITQQLDTQAIERLLGLLVQVRTECGRIFFLGVGGGGGHASHAVNDFRKIAGVECYAPTDNVSELTARINDDGWETSYRNWLVGCRLNRRDAVFVFSVGGGDADRKISANLVCALQYANQVA